MANRSFSPPPTVWSCISGRLTRTGNGAPERIESAGRNVGEHVAVAQGGRLAFSRVESRRRDCSHRDRAASGHADFVVFTAKRRGPTPKTASASPSPPIARARWLCGWRRQMALHHTELTHGTEPRRGIAEVVAGWETDCLRFALGRRALPHPGHRRRRWSNDCDSRSALRIRTSRSGRSDGQWVYYAERPSARASRGCLHGAVLPSRSSPPARD